MSRHQGADRHKHADRAEDFYETPPCATLALLNVEPLPLWVWEPAAGRGAISRVLRDRGLHVHASDLVAYDGRDPDIVTGVDFFAQTFAPVGPHGEACSCVVTNPPFRLAEDRKSTRLNSSHSQISYAVFCL